MIYKPYFQRLLFIVKLAYPRYNCHGFIIYMLKKYLEVNKQKVSYELKAVSNEYLVKILNTGNVCDLNNTIVVDEGIVENRTKFVIMRLNEDGKPIRRIAHVFSRKIGSKSTILLNNCFSYNLNDGAVCNIKIHHVDLLKFADEVEVCLISTPQDWSQFVIDEILKNYFKIPKLVQAGDIIEICLKDYGERLFYSSSKMININQFIYFKCIKVMFNNKIVHDAYFCVNGESTLKLSPNIQSFIPRHFRQAIDPVETPICPYGLESHFANLKRAVQPFITKNSVNFKPVFLLEGRKGSGKDLLVRCVASHFGMHMYTINIYDISANVYAQNETKLKNVLFGAKMSAPTILELKNFEHFGKNSEGQYDERLMNHFTDELETFFQNNRLPVVLFCCTNDKDIPLELTRNVLKAFHIHAPNEDERERVLKWILQINGVHTTANLNHLANKTHGFLFEDLKALVHYALIDFAKEQSQNPTLTLDEAFFSKALDFMQSNYNESLGAPKVPTVQWSDVGGLTDVKNEIIKTIKLPLKHPNLLKISGLKRSGILLFGPPGTGKTLIAKAVATECGLCFLSVKGPELLNMYVGQSEHNVREVFERAREASPCIIFFDELDSLAPNRGASGDSGGVMDRVVSQLLAEMDGLSDSRSIFIIGATNRPDLIDPALLRPGRFDKLLYIGPCVDRASKKSVLAALTKKFRFGDDDSILDRVVDVCPENLSGADFYGICSSAWMGAARRLIDSIESDSGKSESDATLDDVIVRFDDFERALKDVKPSIKQEDLDYFNKLKSDLN